jgi:hypothetical protein
VGVGTRLGFDEEDRGGSASVATADGAGAFTTVVGEGAVVAGCLESTARTTGLESSPLVSRPMAESGSAITAATATATSARRRCRTSTDETAVTCPATVRSTAVAGTIVVFGSSTIISVDGPVVPGNVVGSSPADRSTPARQRIASNALGTARGARGL